MALRSRPKIPSLYNISITQKLYSDKKLDLDIVLGSVIFPPDLFKGLFVCSTLFCNFTNVVFHDLYCKHTALLLAIQNQTCIFV